MAGSDEKGCCLQWLFLLEGTPAVVLGFVICWRLPQDPEHSTFLNPAEQQWCLDRWADPMLEKTQTFDN